MTQTLPPAPTITSSTSGNTPADPQTFLGSENDQGTNGLGWGIPDTTQGAQFLEEEQAAAAAQGGGNPFSGWTLPAGEAGDFWGLYTLAETFAANTGWKYLPTPAQLTTMLGQGLGAEDQQQVYAAFAQQSGINTTDPTKSGYMPWAGLGMSATQYDQASNSLNDTLYELTGQSSFAAAGLGSIAQTAMFQNWTSTQLSDYIQQNPAAAGQYGYLKYGYNYNTFQSYMTENQQSLRSRFGVGFTPQQAVTSLAQPADTFHAAGGAFGQFQPYTPSTSSEATGHQSAER